MPPSSTQKFSGIFVSYRRDDSSGHAGRLADRLVEHFGRNRIFMDIDTIEPGEDFVAVIENAVSSCDILIAVIGRNWLSASATRLENPNDFVRLEIATALRREIRVIPVLVQRAEMPNPQDLPEDLVKLTRRNAIELSDSRWQNDVDQLINVMERVLAKRAEAEHSDEEQRHQEVQETRRVDEQLPIAEEAKLHEHGRNVDAEQEAQDLRADGEGKVPAEPERGRIEELDRRKEITRQSEEDETPEERHVGEAPVRKSNLVTAGAAPPANKHRNLMLIAGASLIVLLAAAILIWQSQRDPNPLGNTNQAPAPQPSAAQPTPAKPTQTAELKPSPPPDPFGAATFWRRDDTGSIYKIVRKGNTLRAFMDNPATKTEAAGRKKGDLVFEGSYDGRTIKGTAYILVLKKDVDRCPAFAGEQPLALNLTLSTDGNTLSGTREEFRISDDCQKINLSHITLTYTKASR